jgi:hypothetical protein
MNWDSIAAVAEIIGTIAVIVSLLYVARQMKEATRQRRVDSYHSVLTDADDFGKLLCHDHDNAEIWWRGSKGLDNLEDAERVQYFSMLFILFRSWEKAFHYHNAGELDDWSADGITRTMHDFARTRGVQEYWSLRQHWYAPEFREWVRERLDENQGGDPYGEAWQTVARGDGSR